MKGKVKIAILGSMVLFSILIGFIVSECGLRFFYSKMTDYDIEMWKYATYLKVPVKDGRGHWHRPEASAKLMGVDVRLNSRGWRQEEFDPLKNPSSERVVFVGDSLTFGWGVAQEKIFSALVQEMFHRDGRAAVALNLGIGNSNTEQQLAALEFENSFIRPDLVVLCFYINDAEMSQVKDKIYWWEASILPVFLKQFWWRLRVQFDSGYHYKAVYNSLYEGESWERYQGVAKRLADWRKANNVDVRIVLLPDIRSSDVTELGAAYNRVEKMYRDLNFKTLNLHQTFPRENFRRFWVAPDDPHFNEEAHSWLALNMYDFIIEHRRLIQ